MRAGFEPGIIRELTIIVTEAMCPAFDGLTVHRCLSTWSLAHHFETAARAVLLDHLDEDEEGIGSHVSVDHLAPCPVGRTVRVRAELTEVIRSHHTRVVCSLTAHDDDRLLARGRQVQVVMNRDHLTRHIERS